MPAKSPLFMPGAALWPCQGRVRKNALLALGICAGGKAASATLTDTVVPCQGNARKNAWLGLPSTRLIGSGSGSTGNLSTAAALGSALTIIIGAIGSACQGKAWKKPALVGVSTAVVMASGNGSLSTESLAKAVTGAASANVGIAAGSGIVGAGRLTNASTAANGNGSAAKGVSVKAAFKIASVLLK
jgi:hypothetical protein